MHTPVRPALRHGRLLLAAGALVLSAVAGAQPMPPRPPLPATAAATAVELQGTVARWLSNPDGEVDGLLLADGTQVAFPPHLSADVTQALKPRDTVKLTGWREGSVFRAQAIRNAASGTTVRDDGPPARPPAPREPGALTAIAASGRIDTLLYGPRGEVNGVVLQGGEVVRFPPHASRQYGALLQRGAMLSTRGFGTRNAFGTSLEATAIGDSSERLQEVFAAPRPRPGEAPRPPMAPPVRPAS